MKDCKARKCKNYLLLFNQFVFDLLKEKREAVLNHKQSMKNDSNNFCNFLAQPFLSSFCKLVANVMAVGNLKASNLSAHMKQNLNALNNVKTQFKNLLIKCQKFEDAFLCATT